MKIVGCDLHTRHQQIAMLDTGDRRADRASSGACQRRSASLLCWVAGAGARGHRGYRPHPLVRAAAGRAGTRVVDRRCGADPGVDGAQAEDRRTRRRSPAAVVAGRTLPADLAADDGRARSAATGLASAEAGMDAQCRGQSTARPSHGRRACAARNSCLRKKAAPSWKAWDWERGPAIAGKSC